MDIDASDRKQQRNFGLLLAVALPLIGGVRWWLTGRPQWPFFAVAAVFLVLGLVLPGVLRPILWVWLKLGYALNWVMTRVLLTLAFVVLITPARVLVSLFSEDPLKRTWDPEAETYWEDAEDQPTELARYRDQF